MAEQHITRDVEPPVLRDLLDRPPRATVAFGADGGADLLPARAHVAGECYRFGVPAGRAPDLSGHEVVLVIDDGSYWFELRGVSVRGIAAPADAPPGRDAPDLVWYAVEARRVLAWDYATLREA